MVSVLAFTGAHLLARCADQGLANFSGKVTLRHGTNCVSWLSIHMFGACPQMGGAKIGGDHGMGFESQNVGRFYMANDADYYAGAQNTISWARNHVFMRLIPRIYAAKSHFNLCRQTSTVPKVAAIGAISPTAPPSICCRIQVEF